MICHERDVMQNEALLTMVEAMAVVTAGLFGILQARAARMDMLGVICLAMVVAFGGGTLRDLLLNRHPLFWILNWHYAVIVFVMATISCAFSRLPRRLQSWLSVPDAVGMALFSIAGAQAALGCGTHPFIAAVMGVITGTFGGVISDVLCGRIPSLFRPSPLYATCAFCGCWIYMGLIYVGISEAFSAIAGIVTAVVMRLTALRRNIRLPALEG